MKGEGNIAGNSQITVGSVVRVGRCPPASFGSGDRLEDRSKWPKCCATIATISNESAAGGGGGGGTASIIWDDQAPLSPPSSWFDVADNNDEGDSNGASKSRRGRRIRRPFLVTPNLVRRAEGLEEEDVPLSSLDSLLPFESDAQDPTTATSAKTPHEFKEQGDALLRLRDYSAAATRYEAALALTSSIELGGTIVLNDGTGRAVLAEVDCVEDDGDTCSVDVTFVDSGEERTIGLSDKDVLLCLLEDDEERIQERMMLNLSRCLLQLADIDGSVDSVRATQYRKAAILGCTLALSCASYGQQGSEGNSTEEKARLIRAGTYLALGKSKHASADARRVLKLNPDSTQAKKLLRDIERRGILKKRSDKKLAKDVCKWVDKATATAEDGALVSEEENGDEESHSSVRDVGDSTHANSNFSSPNVILLRVLIVLFVSIAVKLWMNAYKTLQHEEI